MMVRIKVAGTSVAGTSVAGATLARTMVAGTTAAVITVAETRAAWMLMTKIMKLDDDIDGEAGTGMKGEAKG